MFVAIVVAVAAVAVLVAIVVVAVGRGGELADAHPDYPPSPLPYNRQVAGTDAALLRLPLSLCGYQRQITDEALERFAHALTERDTRIAVLETELAEARRVLGSERSGEQRTAVATRGESPWPVPGEQGIYDPWPEADPERFRRSVDEEAHREPAGYWTPPEPQPHEEGRREGAREEAVPGEAQRWEAEPGEAQREEAVHDDTSDDGPRDETAMPHDEAHEQEDK